MTAFFKRLSSRQRGFTLIELLVVIAILGSLSAVALPNVVPFIASSKTKAAMEEQHSVQVAAMAYAVDHGGTLPTTMNAISPYLSGATEFAWAISGTSVVPAAGNPLTP